MPSIRPDLVTLLGFGLSAELVCLVFMAVWKRVVGGVWPSLNLTVSVAIGVFGVTLLSLLGYVILAH